MATKSKERFEHGEHNEKVCDLIAANGGFPDWSITTAFYAALHFVTFKIFPFKQKAGEVTMEFETIGQWQDFKRYTSVKRHELLKDLVAIHLPAIHPDYDWLLSMSMTARYHHYQHEPLIADKAVRLMKTIKKACEPSTAAGPAPAGRGKT